MPFTTPAATVATVSGCAVTNTFGERFWITPAAQGSVVVWLGVRKAVGRGEGLSGLAFDRIVDVEMPT